MKYVVTQLGARMHYAVPSILENAGMLETFYTDIAASDVSTLKYLPKALTRRIGGLSRLAGRSVNPAVLARTQTFPLLGVDYALRLRLLKDPSKVFLWAAKEFAQRVIKLGFGGANAVYAFNSAALEIMTEAKKRGLRTILEQTIAPKRTERAILSCEREYYAAWEPNYEARTQSLSAFEEKEDQEAVLADQIICGSEFVKRAIEENGPHGGKCTVVPYGFDIQDPNVIPKCKPPKNGKLKVLFMGAVCLRKGAHYVAQAAAKTEKIATFSMVGPLQLSTFGGAEVSKTVKLVGPIPRREAQSYLQQSDIFLLPSLCEGSATVCYEALAAGLPIITTENAGSVVRDGVEGYIVPLRDANAIVERIERLARDRDLLHQMSQNSRTRSTEFTTAEYGKRLLRALEARSETSR
jgi:glycosyltransferase involved in cell wall biosynthesis